MIPLSLYIHIPWCVRKCPYCDFNSHALRDTLPEEQYIAKLLSDLGAHQADVQGRPIHSVFIGGGTPSLLSATAYQRLFQGVREQLELPSSIEITLEANPGASEQGRFYGFREAGVNRLSLGIQSWQPEKLRILGRIHDAEQAAQAVTMAKQAGFNNFNIDIMHGLPQQTIADALADLEKTLLCGPVHISWYQLTLEPNTYFHRFPPTLPADETLWEIQQQGQQRLLSAGFTQYEVSAYCRENRHSRHNRNYWQFGDYIGIGAGAHSKITRLNDSTVWRYWKVKNPRDYLSRDSVLDGQCQIVGDELLLEFLMNALRLHEPIPLSLITERTRLTREHLLRFLSEKSNPALLTVESEYIAATPLGQRFLNELLTGFLP
jgi:putative oxygen-independent coproporphyrinogen III oxidase